MKFKNALLILLAGLLLASCTVQKRVHRKGWFVQWHFDKKDSGKQSDETISIGSEKSSGNSDKSKGIAQNIEQINSAQSTDDGSIVYGDHLVDSLIQDKQESKSPIKPEESSVKTETNHGNPGFGTQIPFATLFLSLITGFAIIATIGLLPILIPIFSSALIAFIYLLAALDNWKGYPEIEARKRNRKNIIVMFILIGAIFLITAILSIAAIPNWVGFALIPITLFLFITITSRQQFNQNLKEEKEAEQIQEKNEEEFRNDQNNTISPPLSKKQAFPNLTNASIAFFVMAIILGLILLFITGLASLLSFTLGIYFLLALALTILFFLTSINFNIRREKAYTEYLNDLRIEQKLDEE